MDEIEILADLVAIASPSGAEGDVAAYVETAARRWGLDVANGVDGVRIEVAGAGPGPTLALVTHLDTVPPGDGWTRDPYDPVIENGRLYGRGSGDAKASVAAMITAARDAAGAGLPAGRLVVLLGREEETPRTTLPRLLAESEPVDAAIVGEPTNLDLAIAQRGLLRLRLTARGDQRHAGRAGEPGFVNAIAVLAHDLVALEGVGRGRPHALLGDPTVTPTILEAGVEANVTPPVARATLDVRTTPLWLHDELRDLIEDAVRAEVEVVSDLHPPCETPAGSRLLVAARAARPEARELGSPTSCDWVWLRDRDAIKCGPGTSPRSHTPDECVDVAEVTAARSFFAALAARYLAPGQPPP